MKMNHISKSLLAVAAVALATGCSDFLDTGLDRNDTAQSVETNRSSIWNFGNAFYTPIIYGFTAIDDNLFAAASDEAQQTSVASNVNYFNQGVVNANLNPLAYLYQNCYEGIRAANYFLDYTADGRGEELLALNRDIVNDIYSYQRDVESLHWYQAEAHIARAYYYAELIKMYGGVPIIEKQVSQTGNGKVPRSTYDEVVDYIVKEIDGHKDYLAVTWNDYAERNGRFTLGAALAIKARVLLYAASPLHNPTGDPKRWEKAAKAAHDIIDHPDLNYALAGNYGEYFVGANPLTSSETIYAVRRGDGNTPERKNYPIATVGGYSGVTPSQNLVEAYECLEGFKIDKNDPYANRDPRLAASIVTNGSTWNGRTIDQSAGAADDMSAANASRTGYYLKKFLTDNLNLMLDQKAQHNWVAFRYAEVLLNYAEAMNEAFGPDATPGDFTLSARTALQLVRDRASVQLPPVKAPDRDAFRDAVKRERRVELAFEDHRYWDLLRWKDAMKVLNEPIRGVEVIRTGEHAWSYREVKVADRTFLERNYYLPFTRSEVMNSGGTLTQNEGY